VSRFSRVRRFFRLHDVDRDIDEELRFHFDRVTEELMEAGASSVEAEREARRRFGDDRRYRARLRQIDRGTAARRRWRLRLGAAGQTVKFAVRSLRRAPGLSLGIIAAFALGIGANATMFGIVDRLLLSPPPHFAEPDAVRRIVIERSFLGRTVRAVTIGIDEVTDLESVPQFEAVAAFSSTNDWILGRGAAARPVSAVLTTGGYWDLVGVRPALGRFYGVTEDRVGADPIVVIGHSLWRAAFDQDPSVLGRAIDFGWGPYTVIGVAPAGFTGAGLASIDLWLPARAAGAATYGERWVTGGRGFNWLRAIVRLAPGASLPVAEQVSTARHRAGNRERIENGSYDPDAHVLVTPLIAAKGPDGSREAKVALWLAGVSAIVLLIACVNVANLLLARSLLRRRETAVRLALGVPRGRLLAQTVLESVLLAVTGGAAALLVSLWAGRLVGRFLLPNVEPVGVDVRMTGVVVTLALLSGVLASLIAAVESRRRDITQVLRAASGSVSLSRQRTRLALAVAQAALSVILLVGAGLFVRSLDRVQSLDLGFDMDRLLMAEPLEDGFGSLAPQADSARIAARRQYFATAADRLAVTQGIRSTAYTVGVPFWTSWSADLDVPGRDSIPTSPSGGPYVNVVSLDYFRTMDLQIVRGRAFEPGDFTGEGLVAIVNLAMASLVWPGGDPIGECMRIEDSDACTTVIGIVEDARRGSIIEEPNPQYYVPVPHPVAADLAPEVMLIRTTADRSDLVRVVRETMLATDSRLRYVTVQPLSDLAAPELRSWRLGASLFTLFGILALAVAALGLYSVLAFDVAQRVREIGLRAALGADMHRLMGEIVGRAIRLTAIGVATGGLVAVLLAPQVADLLFDVSPWDPVTLLGVALALGLVAVAAAGLPAWRAIHVDPSVALRAD
jgi:putative ABC transport system permease protein